jgi:hypothetical protein
MVGPWGLTVVLEQKRFQFFKTFAATEKRALGKRHRWRDITSGLKII